MKISFDQNWISLFLGFGPGAAASRTLGVWCSADSAGDVFPCQLVAGTEQSPRTWRSPETLCSLEASKIFNVVFRVHCGIRCESVNLPGLDIHGGGG